MANPIEEELQFAFPIAAGGVRQGGMTLRDYFAAKAMQGLLNATSLSGIETGGTIQAVIYAYKVADQMIAQRES